MSGVCTCEGNKTDGQIKVQRDRQGEEEKMARGQNSQGGGCTEYLGSVGQHQIPTSGDHRVGGGAALLTAPSGAGPRQEPHPRACSTRPSHQGSLSHGSGQAGAQRRQEQQRAAGGRAEVETWRGRAGQTYPFCCGVLSAGGFAPKGRAVLLREALGAKVYRGGSAAGARAWAETERGGRAGRGEAGDLAKVGRPLARRGQRYSSPTPTHLA